MTEKQKAKPPGKKQTMDTNNPADKSGKSTKDAYLVLARKYRPADFKDLIGQEPMVQTLRNAFESNRIAQGFMLSGVRGVGKTTTARILARALNYETDAISDPTIDMDQDGTHCASIMAGTHVDVMEMDAASHTGIDDIREIIEAARYKPVSARYKVYIIDEVHMLSKSAFNGLLKTLEEPPAHVKFIFATTELRKVPVTVLSRCQRFDLRRIDIRDLETHFSSIAEKEDVKIDGDAISLIARAAEGSVRDGLSLLDQAFARAEKTSITAENIRSMLGLADQAEILNLLNSILGGHAQAALTAFQEFYEKGADPQQIISELAEAIHLITRTKALAGAAGNSTNLNEDLPEAAKEQVQQMSENLSMAVLNRGWQTLLKGFDEVGKAPNQLTAAEMIIMRLLYMADLPSPADLIAALEKATDQEDNETGGGVSNTSPDQKKTSSFEQRATAQNRQSAQGEHSGGSTAKTVNGDHQSLAPEQQESQPQTELNVTALPTLNSYEDLLNLVGHQRDVKLKLQLEEYAELVRFSEGSIELHLLEGADDGLAGDLTNKLARWTGSRWIVALSHERGDETIGNKRRKQEEKELEQIKSHPTIKDAMQQFPGAKITAIKPIDKDKQE